MTGRSRSRASAKRAGARMEAAVAAYLAAALADGRIERRAPTGARDRGDITGVTLADGRGRVVVEVKDVARTTLAAWITQAQLEATHDGAAVGVVVAKRQGRAYAGDQWVHMTLRDLAVLLGATPASLDRQPPLTGDDAQPITPERST